MQGLVGTFSGKTVLIENAAAVSECDEVQGEIACGDGDQHQNGWARHQRTGRQGISAKLQNCADCGGGPKLVEQVGQASKLEKNKFNTMQIPCHLCASRNGSHRNMP